MELLSKGIFFFCKFFGKFSQVLQKQKSNTTSVILKIWMIGILSHIFLNNKIITIYSGFTELTGIDIVNFPDFFSRLRKHARLITIIELSCFWHVSHAYINRTNSCIICQQELTLSCSIYQKLLSRGKYKYILNSLSWGKSKEFLKGANF